MYDMYAWDRADAADDRAEVRPARPAPSRPAPSGAASPPARPGGAVQVALDRRDNGGAAGH